MKKQVKLKTYIVSFGVYKNPFRVRAENVKKAKLRAYWKLYEMDFDEFFDATGLMVCYDGQCYK